MEGLIGAGRHERSAERPDCRDGHRERALGTRLGTSRPRVPKPRQGGHFPPFPEPGKVGGGPVAVTREAWTGGVSTRRVDGLAPAAEPGPAPIPPRAA